MVPATTAIAIKTIRNICPASLLTGVFLERILKNTKLRMVLHVAAIISESSSPLGLAGLFWEKDLFQIQAD